MWYYAVYFAVTSFVFLFLGAIWNRDDFLNLFLKMFFLFLMVWSIFFTILNAGFIVHV